MKKAAVILSTAVCLAGALSAQTKTDYQEMNEWLFSYMLNGVTPQSNMHEYDRIKMEWSNFGDDIYDKIKASLPPIDPSITAAIENLHTQYNTEANQKAIELGYASFDDLYYQTYKGTKIPNDAVAEFYTWYKQRGVEVNDERLALMKSYNDELNSHFQAAFIEAVKKLQENSASMQ